MKRLECSSHDEWISARRDYITASDAGAVLGLSPWKSSADLFDEKTGSKEPKDISHLRGVEYGVKMEPLLRAQAEIELPYFSWEYHQYDLLVSDEYPWMGATLDGELEVIADNPWGFPIGTRGVFEAKTGSFRRESDIEEWESYIPSHYLAQTCHQLIVTGYEFVIVKATLRRDAWKDEDNGFPEIRNYYRIVDRRSEVIKEWMSLIIESEKEFYRALQKGIRPSVMLAI